MTAAKRVVSKRGEDSWTVGTIQSVTDKVKESKDAPIKVKVSRHFTGDMPGSKCGSAVCRAPVSDHGFIKGDAYGREFESREEAREFLRKRGYTQPFYSQKESLKMSVRPEETIRKEARECVARMVACEGEIVKESPRKEDWHKYIRLVRMRGDSEERREMFRDEFEKAVKEYKENQK